MTVLVFAVVALVGYRLWMRVREAETTIEKLTARVTVLEQVTTAPGPSRQTPAHQKADVITPAAGGQSGPVSGIQQEVPPPEWQPPSPIFVPPVVAGSELSPSAGRHPLGSQIGSRWLLEGGVAAIVIGVSYFEKLAIENHWVNETWRVIQGGVAGLALIAGGLRIAKKGYRLYGQILAGAGVAIMYVSTYAAFNFYHLISHPIAFALMLAITALAAWLADSQQSQGLAVVAVSGGFATPFLLPTGTDAEAALFTYNAILIAGTMVLASRRNWPSLNIVSYLFTALTFLSWA